MGGGPEYYHPKNVWSWAGGWYNHNPPNWRRNTGFVAVGVAVCALTMINYARKLEERPYKSTDHTLFTDGFNKNPDYNGQEYRKLEEAE